MELSNVLEDETRNHYEDSKLKLSTLQTFFLYEFLFQFHTFYILHHAQTERIYLHGVKSMLFIKLNCCQFNGLAVVLHACLCLFAPAHDCSCNLHLSMTFVPFAPNIHHVSIKAAHYPKYLDQFLMILLATFTRGLIAVKQSKQAVTSL